MRQGVALFGSTTRIIGLESGMAEATVPHQLAVVYGLRHIAWSSHIWEVRQNKFQSKLCYHDRRVH
jgi:hypothetical protein